MEFQLSRARYNLTEIEDKPWCPPLWRSLAMDYLRSVFETFHIFRCTGSLLARELRCDSPTKVQDLCSGTGGPWRMILPELRSTGAEVDLTLTDLYPHADPVIQDEFRTRGITYSLIPVDACTAPLPSVDLITMFNALHHFKDEDARDILRSVIGARCSLAFFEITERTLPSLLMVLLTPLLVLGTTPLIRPFSWKRIALTYLIPVVPVFATIDGVISVLRSFTVRDLRAMTHSIPENSYDWSIGRCKSAWYLPSVVYMIGRPSSLFRQQS